MAALVTPQRRRLAAWVMGILVVVLGFIRIESVIDRVETEARRRSYVQCVSSNEARQGILDFITGFVTPPISPEEQQFLDRAEESFAQKPCPPDPDADDGR